MDRDGMKRRGAACSALPRKVTLAPREEMEVTMRIKYPARSVMPGLSCE